MRKNLTSALPILLIVAGAFAGCSDSKEKDSDEGTGGSAGKEHDGGVSGGKGDGGKGTGGASSTGGRSTTETGGSGGQDDGGADPDAGGGGGDPGDTDGGTAGAATTCGVGTVIEGNPLYTDAQGNPKAAGQGVLADPPVLPSQAIAVIGNKLFVNSQEEIWMADLDGTSPQIKRIAGLRGSKKIDAGELACKDTRLLVVTDMVATPDGKLALVDYIGGAILELTDPTGPNCKSHWVAGTHATTEDPANAYPANHGDVDGPGAQARFGGDPDVTGVGGAGIHHIAVDPAGNYYTWDEGTGKIKKIAADADRTVSTVGHTALDDDNRGLTWLNGKLYGIANDSGIDNPLIEVDTTKFVAADLTGRSKNIKEVFRLDSTTTGAVFPDLDGTGKFPAFSGLSNDGHALIVSSALGFIWRVETDGTYLATLAGTLGSRGPGRLEFEDDFDPTKPHPANEWQLLASPGGSQGPWVTVNGGSVYWNGGIGTGDFVVKFACH